MAKKKAIAPFTLENADCTMTGLSMSFDRDGDEPVSRRTLTLVGIERTEEQIDAHLGKYTHRAWFNKDAATGKAAPMPYWEKGGAFEVAGKFDLKSLVIQCGSRKLRFEAESREDGESTAAGKVKEIRYMPQDGGVVLMSMKLSVRPDSDQAAVLEEYFERHVKITLGEFMPESESAPKQTEMPMAQGSAKSGPTRNGQRTDQSLAFPAEIFGSIMNRNSRVDVTEIDSRTLAYMELVSGKSGQSAVDAWLKFTGWRDESDSPISAKTLGQLEAQIGNICEGPEIGVRERKSARRQIPIQARIRRAFENARELALQTSSKAPVR